LRSGLYEPEHAHAGLRAAPRTRWGHLKVRLSGTGKILVPIPWAIGVCGGRNVLSGDPRSGVRKIGDTFRRRLGIRQSPKPVSALAALPPLFNLTGLGWLGDLGRPLGFCSRG
jgi:hypothetical protein